MYSPRIIAAVIIGCVGPPVLMLGILVVLAIQASSSESEHRQIVHAYETRMEVARVYSLILDAESGQRGYVLTGDATFLVPYVDANAKLEPELRRLAEMVAGDAIWVRDDAELQETAHLKLQELADTVNLRRIKDVAGAVAVVEEGEGVTYMERIRKTVARMDQSINGQTAAAIRKTEQTAARTLWLVADLLGVCIIFVIGATALAVTTFRKRRYLAKILGVERDESDRVSLAKSKVERRLHRQVRISNHQLKIANEGLQKFTSIVAHDLRGPLRRIEAFVEILQTEFRTALNDEGADMLDRIEGGAARMRLMLDSLLQYSRYSSAAIAGKKAKIGAVINDALSVFDVAALGVEVIIELEGVSEVKGDSVLLSHVLQNLIGNAVKFRNGKSPVIAITARQTDQLVTLSVADNGIGIDPKFASKIFEMFYRLHDEDEYEGAGIGLSVCRKIINDHGGQIWMDVDYPHGARFSFTLQAQQELEAPSHTTAAKVRAARKLPALLAA